MRAAIARELRKNNGSETMKTCFSVWIVVHGLAVGAPSGAVGNMTGVGSVVAANHVFKAAKPEGLTIGHFTGGLFLGQVLGQPGIEFDARKFKFIEATSKDPEYLADAKMTRLNVDPIPAGEIEMDVPGLFKLNPV